jgi:hypothetical protein
MQQVLYFYEGESEKKLITYLKDRQIIKQNLDKFILFHKSVTVVWQVHF